MRTFTDTAGNTWSIVVTVDAIRRVRQLAAVDLMQILGGGPLLEQLANDPVLLVDVLAAVCKPQIDAKHMTPETFGQAMSGDVIDAATQALLLGIADFSPSPIRAMLMQLIAMGRANQQQAHDRAMRELDKMMPTPSGEPSPSPPPSPA